MYSSTNQRFAKGIVSQDNTYHFERQKVWYCNATPYLLQTNSLLGHLPIRYSLGVMPIIFLKERLKYCGYW